MDTLLQVAGLGLIAVLLGLVLKKGNGVLALLLTLAARTKNILKIRLTALDPDEVAILR